MQSKHITITWLNSKVDEHRIANASDVAKIYENTKKTLPRGVCLTFVNTTAEATEAQLAVKHQCSKHVTCDLYAILHKAPFIFDVTAQVFLDCSFPLQSCSVPLAMDIVPHHFATVFPWHFCFSDENGEVALITESLPRMYIGDPYLHSISQW